jgi:hypothetical protein
LEVGRCGHFKGMNAIALLAFIGITS